MSRNVGVNSVQERASFVHRGCFEWRSWGCHALGIKRVVSWFCPCCLKLGGVNVMLGSINMSYWEIKGGFIDRWFLNRKMILWQQLGEFSV